MSTTAEAPAPVQALDAPGTVPDPTDAQKRARDNFRKRHGGAKNITAYVDVHGVQHLGTVPGTTEDEYVQVAADGTEIGDPRGGMAAYRPGYDAYVAARVAKDAVAQEDNRPAYTAYRRYYAQVLAAKKASGTTAA